MRPTHPRWITGALLIPFLAACSGTPPTHLGVQDDGQLAPCPDSPNCVSSFANPDNERHHIAPLAASEQDWERLVSHLQEMSRTEVVERGDHYVRAEATSRLMRFVDDVELLHQPEQSTIQVRSASRIGRSDFGVNRDRVEHYREFLSTE